jgi:hypothetical protein
MQIGAAAAQTLERCKITSSTKVQRQRVKYEELLDNITALEERMRWEQSAQSSLQMLPTQAIKSIQNEHIVTWVASADEKIKELVSWCS